MEFPICFDGYLDNEEIPNYWYLFDFEIITKNINLSWANFNHTMTLVYPKFLVYVVNVFSLGSTTVSSTTLTTFLLINLSPHLGTLFVFVNSLFEYNFPSLTSRDIVSSESTWVLERYINMRNELWTYTSSSRMMIFDRKLHVLRLTVQFGF